MSDQDEQEAWTMVNKIAGLIERAEAAEGERDAIRNAAEWLVANRGHRGEKHAWELLDKALAKDKS